MATKPTSRRPADPFAAAEAVFKKGGAPAAAEGEIPALKEQVTLRIDADVLEFFREDGPGWQDRINAALRKAAGKD